MESVSNIPVMSDVMAMACCCCQTASGRLSPELIAL